MSEAPSGEHCGVLRVVVVVIIVGLPDSRDGSTVSGAGSVRDGG